MPSDIKRLIAAERRDVIRFTVKLIIGRNPRQRARWAALQRYHAAQAAKWEGKL